MSMLVLSRSQVPNAPLHACHVCLQAMVTSYNPCVVIQYQLLFPVAELKRGGQIVSQLMGGSEQDH